MTEDALLDRRRAQVGASILPLATGDRAVARTGKGWWLVLSGTPSAEGNTGLVFSDDEHVLRDVVAQVEGTGLPTELLTAGSAPDRVLTAPWQESGSMPFMAVELAATPTAPSSDATASTCASSAPPKPRRACSGAVAMHQICSGRRRPGSRCTGRRGGSRSSTGAATSTLRPRCTSTDRRGLWVER